ncbi:ABC transporter substrate-binding protein [Anoxybacterium hadale]|uniref:ABC transporter substrate-binding protein n=1 Tax=Anoxybacterium hadale TaxID=3408580 RepID=A0ACD1ACT2_9FIRM|nr:ABC transporter substrate-binding protein [Clostridiales bacterium]
MKKLTRRLLSVLLAVGIIATLIAGCSSKTEDTADRNTQTKHVNAALSYMEPGLDPSNGTYGWVTIRMGVTECLVKLNDDVEVEPLLATDVKNIDDLTWEITIRDGVTFSNGTPVTAETVKQCLDRTLKLSSRAVNLSKISSMVADGQTLTVTTSEPNGAFKNNLCEPVFSIYDASQSDEDINHAVIGTGPFKVTAFAPEQSAELAKNETYWGGEVGLDTVSITYISDAEARKMALQSGELDIATNIDMASATLFSDASQYNISTSDSLRVYNARINTKEVSPLKDDKLREALSYAVDREAYAELIGGSAAHGVFADATPFGNKTVTAVLTYDKEKAMKLLDDAGYIDVNGDGIREKKDGSELTLIFMVKGSFGSSDAGVLATAIQSDFKAVGINMELRSMESSGHSEPDTYWDFYTIQNNTATTGDPQSFLEALYASDSAIGYHSDKIDEILEKLNSTFDIQARYKLAAEATQHLNENTADLYLTNGYLITISNAKVQNANQPVCDYYFLTKDITVK